MSDEQNKNIVLLLFQPSIIVRGIEKKMTELGYKVISLVGNLDEMDSYLEDTDLFIMNLPGDILDDQSRQIKLSDIDRKLCDCKKHFVIVGEQELQKELGNILPGVVRNPWIFRPVDLESVGSRLEGILNMPIVERRDKKRILIVDDDPSFATMAREWTKDTYKVDIVTGGKQALSFLEKVPGSEPVNLILLDYDMPQMDGPEVLKALQANPATAGIPVVFLTGIGTKESVARVMALKPRGYVLKSTPREELLASIKGVLDKG